MKSHPFWHQLRWTGSAEGEARVFFFFPLGKGGLLCGELAEPQCLQEKGVSTRRLPSPAPGRGENGHREGALAELPGGRGGALLPLGTVGGGRKEAQGAR